MMPKFRVFDKNKKQMVESAWWDFYFEDEGLLTVTSDLDVSYYADDLGEVWEIMQSTGLHDKNGKEIYEGDIINCRDLWLDGDRRKTHKQIVKYDSGMFSAGYVSLRTSNSTSEIIGNIYENPELLEEDDKCM
ncbi:YopX protein [Macrococcoides canis]|uniref:YopX protein n=1 Tax=Macrococcoides canis TaxID=1855823 RepID=A0A1W7ABT4_9STAP|nr:YopX family protein [Macrococcus canis]ARQ07073.1 YopX protein [Macrococcus canis]